MRFLVFLVCLISISGFSPSPLRWSARALPTAAQDVALNMASTDLSTSKGYAKSGEIAFPDDPTEMSDAWELDLYSRPVLLPEDGKKLWEVLITDDKNSFRYLKSLPNNLVNSRNLRKVVEDLIEESPKPPATIRFFRNQMLNMITIALKEIDVDVKPSRRVYNLYSWLQEREANIYPAMDGYNRQLKQQTILDYDIRQPDKLPDVLKSESYAFVALPAEAFHNKEVNEDNINRGKLCPLEDMPLEGWIHGITLFSKRSDSVAAWMNGLEMSFLQANLLSRELMLNTDISTQFVVAPLMDQQKKEAQIFERGKVNANGYHFISVQADPESEEVEGFWLMREFTEDL